LFLVSEEPLYTITTSEQVEAGRRPPPYPPRLLGRLGGLQRVGLPGQWLQCQVNDSNIVNGSNERRVFRVGSRRGGSLGCLQRAEDALPVRRDDDAPPVRRERAERQRGGGLVGRGGRLWQPPRQRGTPVEREFFIDNLLGRIHLIIEMILVNRPCAMGV